MKYRTKLLIGVVLLSSILFISITQLSLNHQKQIAEQEIALKEQLVRNFLERFLVTAITEFSSDQVSKDVEELVNLEPIAYIHVYDQSGRLLLGHGEQERVESEESIFGKVMYDRKLVLSEEPYGTLEVHYGVKSDYQEGFFKQSRTQLFIIAAVFVLAVLLAAYFALRVYTKELKSIRSAMHRISNGEFSHRITDGECGELVLTAKAINSMCEKLELNEQIEKAEHLRLKELSLAVENSPISVFMTDSKARIIYVNPFFLTTTGYEEHEVIGQTPRILNSGVNDDEDYDELWQTIKAGNIWRGELINRRKDGSLFCDKTIIAPVTDDDEQVTHYIAVKEDVTEYKQVEKRLRATQTVFDAASEAIMVTDLNGEITMVNPAFYEITGYEEQEVLGHNPKVLSSGHHDDEFYKAMFQELLRNNRWEGEIWNRRKSGEVYPQWQTISLIRDEEGDPLEYVALFADITKRKAEEAEIRYRANYDPLTGLANRSLFYEQLGQVIKQARRHKQGVAVMYLDLDGFKEVNDQYGHFAGDRVLQSVSETLTNTVRESDSICRMGGDEFVICLSQVEKPDSLERIAEKIIVAISAPIEVDQQPILIGASVGISIFPNDTDDPEDLVLQADNAMYEAKQSGKNRYYFARPLKAS